MQDLSTDPVYFKLNQGSVKMTKSNRKKHHPANRSRVVRKKNRRQRATMYSGFQHMWSSRNFSA